MDACVATFIKIMDDDLGFGSLLEDCLGKYNKIMNETVPQQVLESFKELVNQITEQCRADAKNLKECFRALKHILDGINEKGRAMFSWILENVKQLASTETPEQVNAQLIIDMKALREKFITIGGFATLVVSGYRMGEYRNPTIPLPLGFPWCVAQPLRTQLFS